MHPTILKFGGSSVGNAQRIQNVAKIILSQKEKYKVVVVSVVQKITDLLINTANSALENNESEVKKNLQILKEIHFEIIEKNIANKDQKIIHEVFNDYLNRIKNIYQGISCLNELSPQTLDLISSFGERMSAQLMAFTLKKMGINAQKISAAEIIRTDETFNGANVDFPQSEILIRKHIHPLLKKNIIPIVTGFIAGSIKGNIVTLGRGGSDYTAAILGICLDAKEIQIWTDVSGILTTDPRIVKQAKIIPQITFKETAELAYFGAKVLHPKTIQPAVEKNIPVRILNTFKPEDKGTIVASGSKSDEIKAISFLKNITLIRICSSRMLGQYGFLAKIFEIFSHHKISIDVVTTSEVSVSLSINTKDLKPELIEDLQKYGKVQTEKNLALICIVGNKLKNDLKKEAIIFETLTKNKIPTEIISKGASNINITFLIKEELLEKAVKALHKSLFE